MYPYEGMFLVDPTAHAADAAAVEGVVRALLEKHGAKIQQLEVWDERKLAYEIQGHSRGVYLLGYFEMPGSSVDPMRREIKIKDEIYRELIIRLETDIPTHLERTAKYEEKMKSDVEARRDRPDRGDRGDRPDRGDRGDRPDRGDRGDRPDRGDRGDRPPRRDREDGDRGASAPVTEATKTNTEAAS